MYIRIGLRSCKTKNGYKELPQTIKFFNSEVLGHKRCNIFYYATFKEPLGMANAAFQISST